MGRTSSIKKDSGKRPTILLADDDLRFLRILRKLLEPEFKIVASVRDGQALIKATQALSPDLIVTDISMPILSGLQAVRRLKTLQPGALILFITMHDERAFVAEARKVGARGYVFKHHVHSHLLPAAREALRNGPFFSSAMQE